MANKLGDPAGCHYLVTSLTFYYSTVTDLTLSRSIHATELEPCCPDPYLLSSSECRAIHYGQCSSILKLPTFAIVPPGFAAQAKSVKSVPIQQQDPSSSWQRPDTGKSSVTHTDESLDGKNSDSLETLIANIEENIKPFLNILSSCEVTNSSHDNGEEENIGSLASSLQLHLGNFIAAFRQQQQQESELNGPQRSSLSPQRSFSHKKTEISTNPNISKNHPNEFNVPASDWSNDLLKTRSKHYGYEHEDGTGDPSSCDNKTCKITNDVADNRLLDGKPNYLLCSETASTRQKEVMRILNRNDPIRDWGCNNINSAKDETINNLDSVDSDLLDSLISLMNVSLVGLEDSAQKQNRQSSKKVNLPNTESPHLNDSEYVSDNYNLRHHEVSVKNTDKPLSQYAKCRRRLNFDTENNSNTSYTALKSHHFGGAIASHRNVLQNQNETLNCEKWSISAMHRRDSVIPNLPSYQDAKKSYVGSRCNNTPDHDLVLLTKSSVAERVLAFEKCPDWKTERATGGKELIRKSVGEWELSSVLPKKAKQSSHLSFDNLVIRSGKKSSQIPKFHFPNGPPSCRERLEAQLELLENSFERFKGKVTYDDFHIVTKACGLPLYWKMPFYLAVGTDKLNFLTTNRFLDFWKSMTALYHDEPSRFVYILSRGNRQYLLPEDFRPMIQDIVDTHIGLSFLRESKEFHSRYIDTVISRIFYDVNRSWSGKITALELRKSTFLQAVTDLGDDDFIYPMTEYFSYEHFYVIYCKFWKIDVDHDLIIDANDLMRHNHGDISTRMIQRIFSGAVSSEMRKTGDMRYTDFVWFLLAEEDKRHPRSIEYWFRCMDLNGDGFLSMYELEYFYDEQVRRMEDAGLETMPFTDCLCQMLDMVRPRIPDKISLSDLKKCKLTALFFDTFFNFRKYLEHEQKDPFAAARLACNGTSDISDWCRYAEEEYSRLICEENACGRSEKYSGGSRYYSAENAAFSKNEDDDDYADSDADY